MLRAQHEDLPEDLERATAGLDAEVQVLADLRELVADLQELPEDQRAALLLSEIRDLSHAEVAEVLGCKATQVGARAPCAGGPARGDARDADCEEIRVELAAARGGGFRRGRLRHHLNSCPACSTYREQVSQQRKMLVVVLPVVPSLGLKADVLAAIGLGGGAASGGLAAGSAAATGVGAGAVATGGGIATTATVAKIAAVAVIAGGSGIAGISAIDRGVRPGVPRWRNVSSGQVRRPGTGARPARACRGSSETHPPQAVHPQAMAPVHPPRLGSPGAAVPSGQEGGAILGAPRQRRRCALETGPLRNVVRLPEGWSLIAP